MVRKRKFQTLLFVLLLLQLMRHGPAPSLASEVSRPKGRHRSVYKQSPIEVPTLGLSSERSLDNVARKTAMQQIAENEREAHKKEHLRSTLGADFAWESTPTKRECLHEQVYLAHQQQAASHDHHHHHLESYDSCEGQELAGLSSSQRMQLLLDRLSSRSVGPEEIVRRFIPEVPRPRPGAPVNYREQVKQRGFTDPIHNLLTPEQARTALQLLNVS